MAWNPSPEVAVARDAARRISEIGNARVEHMVVIWTAGRGYGMASYGPTKALCSEAGDIGDFLFRTLGQYLVGLETESDVRQQLETVSRIAEVLKERLRAVADHEHCMTEHTVDGLRQLAKDGLTEAEEMRHANEHA